MRPTIAILSNRYNDIKRPAIEQMAAQLNEAGYGVVCLIGRELEPVGVCTSECKQGYNRIYEDCAHFSIQGYIVLSASLSFGGPYQSVVELIQCLQPKPVVSFGIDVPGVHSLVPDNHSGMSALMTHMTSDSSRQNFVFLRGGLTMPDSIEREARFRDALSEKGIQVREDYILNGSFFEADSYAAMCDLLKKTIDIDAVVAANDHMAIGAVQALREHGLRVPEDVIVSGFDDREVAAECVPPLTSVSYRFAERSRYVVDALIAQIEGGDASAIVENCVNVDAHLIIRESSTSGALNLDDCDEQPALRHVMSGVEDAVELQTQTTKRRRQKQQLETERVRRWQDDLHIELASSTSIVELEPSLARFVNELAIQRLYIVLPNRSINAIASTSTVVLSFDQQVSHWHQVCFDTNDILPPDLQHECEQGLLVMVPLCNSSTPLGYMLVDPSGLHTLSVENLATSIASAVSSCDRLQALEHQALDLRHKNASLSYMAVHDELTGLQNRRGFKQHLSDAIQHAQETESRVEVIFIDLDGFKNVNDTCGHEAGDQILNQIAMRLKDALPDIGCFARFGGDEFAILTTGSPPARQVALRILKLLEKPFCVTGPELFLAASIGISRWGNGTNEGSSLDELLKQSDTAMYHAKASGKNRYSQFSDIMATQLRKRILLESAIRKGIENGEFSVEYQPRVHLATGNIQGFEALMRWKPSNSLIAPEDTSPASFIPIAEATGSVVKLDRLALEQACQQLKMWSDIYQIQTCISVNMSVMRLQQQGLVDEIRDTIQRFGINPGMIELELTESAAMDDVALNITTLKELRLLGVKVAIDDFGTGYSSLAYLKKLPVNCLKIDQSFVHGVERDSNDNSDAAIIKTIITLGKSMGYTMIAEGVERQEQSRFLIDNGCELGQGFLYSRSLSPADATSLLTRSNDALLQMHQNRVLNKQSAAYLPV